MESMYHGALVVASAVYLPGRTLSIAGPASVCLEYQSCLPCSEAPVGRKRIVTFTSSGGRPSRRDDWPTVNGLCLCCVLATMRCTLIGMDTPLSSVSSRLLI